MNTLPSTPLRAPRVLIVDDNEDNLIVLTDAIEDEGYEITAVSSGAEALAAVDRERPDVILLDILMPGMDGIECCRTLKSDERTAPIPVILVTALSEDRHVIDGLDAGAVDYVAKPFARPVVQARVRAALRSKLAHDQLQGQHAEIAQLAGALAEKNKTLAALTDTAHRFVDNVAHEFRTPLAVIKEFSSIIADGLGGPVTDDQREFLQFIEGAARDLAGMVDDFLDSSKLKARILRVDRRRRDVAEIVAAATPLLETRARQKRIRIELDLPSEPLTVFADGEKIARVLINLGVNAVKFSPEGSRVRLWAEAEAGGGIRLGVTDEGPGLSPEDAAQVFTRFKQVGAIDRVGAKGFGLGLSIARELIWLNLGTVGVDTTLGRGSTFSFTLPPDDVAVILRCYFDRFRELDELPFMMSALAVTPSAEGSVDEVRRFLVAACYPTDVAFIADDQRSVILLGPTAEPEKWSQRLQDRRAAETADPPAGADLVFEQVGRWSFHEAEAVLPSLFPEMLGDRVLAQTHTPDR